MAKRRRLVKKIGPFGVIICFLAVAVVLVGILAKVRTYVWKNHLVDGFLSIKYPLSWSYQKGNGWIAPYGEEVLFLASDYSGQLSTQDWSSKDQSFLLKVSKTPLKKVGNLDNYIEPYKIKCAEASCAIEEKSLGNVETAARKLSILSPGQFYEGENYLFFIKDNFIYEIHIGYSDSNSWGRDTEKQKVIDRVINSVAVLDK